MSRTDFKQSIKVEQGYICPVCGSICNDYTMNIHHKIPKCKGGETKRDNLVGWCIKCHSEYHKKYGVMVSDDYGRPVGEIVGFRKAKKKRKRRKH